MLVVGIPYWEADGTKETLLMRCVASLKGYDKLIVLAGRQPTLPDAWNKLLDMGFKMGASHVILANDDLTLVKGELYDLQGEGVISPHIIHTGYKKFHAHMMCIPKEVYERVGKFDNRFQHYWSDTDYAKRLVEAGVPVTINMSVEIDHPKPGTTLKYTKTGDQDEAEYIKKWGGTDFDPAA